MKIVVTGSSSGIGRGLAERLLSRGHTVWGLARSDQGELQQRHAATFRFTRVDVASWSQVTAAAEEIAHVWNGIDALVTCAGIQGAIGRTADIDPQRWSETIRANLDGTFHAIRAFWPLLAHASPRAKIVCFSGGGATKARPNFSAYACAKTAIVRLVENIATEESQTQLDINAIAPGAIHTRMTDEVITRGPEVVGEAEHRAALNHAAQDPAPLERALDLVEWLLSPASDGISGRLISAPWDPWSTLGKHRDDLRASDIFTLRRITPEDRGLKWS